ncbi:MAG: hypothetical protein QME59_06025, partial [Candidatus Hydrothermarchaeota archaeon]|nr:hypothetical protein [Candidatus Hydrothermarchaeota archaeon]
MKIVILAVTKMQGDRICLAGINESNEWVRPVKRYPYHLEKSDLFNEKTNQIIYENFNIVDIPLIKKLEKSPHSEDYIIGSNKIPTVISNLPIDKREKFLLEHSDNNLLKGHSEKPINKLLEKVNRSLVLIGPVKINYVVLEKDKTPRIHFEITAIYKSDRSLPCTDLKFRAFGRSILKAKNSQKVVLNSKQLTDILKTDKIFIGIGLTRE